MRTKATLENVILDLVGRHYLSEQDVIELHEAEDELERLEKWPVCTGWMSLPKHEPIDMLCCDCFSNCICPVCGFGWGAIPCGCDGMKRKKPKE